MGLLSRHKKEKLKAEEYYKSIVRPYCPYFSKEIVFNSDGFHHLQFSSGSEREKQSQLHKFNLLPYVVEILKKSGTVQEYRKQWGKVGRKKTDGSEEMKEMEYWGFVAIVDNHIKTELPEKIKVILRRVGNGNIIFWSVMRDVRLNTNTRFNLATDEIAET